MNSETPPPASGQIKSRMHGQTLVLTLSNPEFRNALSPSMYASAVEALSVAGDSNTVGSVVFVGEGSHFCAGGNLQRLAYNRGQPRTVQGQSIEQLNSWIDEIRSFPKPVVAAIEGAAAGAGFSLALACDMIVAAQNSVFAMSYVNVGLSPDGGGSWHLARALPRQLASEIMMLGGKTHPERLHALGLVNRLSDPGRALDDALTLCEQLNAKAPTSLESIKLLANEAQNQSLQTHLQAELSHFVENLHHANGGEGISAFLEKRPPRYIR